MSRPEANSLSASPSARSVWIAESVLAAVGAHASSAMPEESCGALLGYEVGGARRIVRAVAVENQEREAPERRYRIPASAVRVLESRAEEEGLAVVGYYHSHPTGVAVPSPEDLGEAWPWYSYLIVPVEAGTARPGTARSWRLRDDREGFEEEQIMRMEEEAWR